MQCFSEVVPCQQAQHGTEKMEQFSSDVVPDQQVQQGEQKVQRKKKRIIVKKKVQGPFWGMVYVLISRSGKMYIGSSQDTPKRRLDQHWYDFVEYQKNPQKRKMTSIELFKEGRENVDIQVLYDGVFQSLKELHQLEGKYIRQMQCVNKYQPGRKSKDRKNYNREYYLRLKQMQVGCKKCKKIYTKDVFYWHAKKGYCKLDGGSLDQND